MFDQPIRPEGSEVSSEAKKAAAREIAAIKRAERKAMKLATGEKLPSERKGGFSDPANRNTKGRPKSIVNRVTEYGALFNKMNEEHMEKGHGPLKTAMEVLIMAMQSNELDLKEKAKIAEKLATFESSRAPVISIEHVQNLVKEEDVSADDALDEFLDSLRKV
jgi:hypothetical protein